jgi:hypothetical protein
VVAEGQNETAVEFPCEAYGPSDPVPTSAKRLRPADIKVLGALGDRCTRLSYIHIIPRSRPTNV